MRGPVIVALFLLLGCSATEPGNSPGTSPGTSPTTAKLVVTERSGSTLSLRWDVMDTASTYALDYLTGIAKCTDFPVHNTGLVIKGTTAQLTGLSPAIRYHIHVHALPFSPNKITNTVFVLTLPAGAPAQAATVADYESCISGP